MAKIPQYAWRNITVAAGATRYMSLSTGGLNESATESDVQRTVKTAGRHSNLFIRVTANTIDADTIVTFRINGADGNQTVTLVGDVLNTTYEDTVNVDDVVADDLICLKVVGGAGGTNLIYTVSGTMFDATTNTVSAFGTSQGNVTVDSTDKYSRFSGASNIQDAEDELNRWKFSVAGTMKNMNVVIPSNARTTNTLFKFRKNGSTQSIIATATSGLTGQLLDSTNSFTIAVDDLVNRLITTGASGGTLAQSSYVDFETTDRSQQMLAWNVTTLAASATSYEPIMGRLAASTTEADVQIPVGCAGVLSLGRAGVSANTIVTGSTATLRKNGSDTALVVQLDALGTGYFDEDSPTTIAVVATDMMSWKCVGGAGGTSLSLRSLGLKFVATVATIAPISTGHHQRGLR